ncbi:right-handed parallel beta-helix repeat-containing protein [Coraliomargarita sp. SDUM461004]|uniref:Right-handed parallel beta-helix repeat-containing protein n=1 Tax=Thalassobacterium sedimentorum TaxID=3041258 RepID=A0ABU1AEI0_9BACT|nr:right-handed parallel beta-helix repeat-containing protein [Coraliomargarita sp. SDUM461004]MDQ8192904.1 right-handed parallel beta-helix repeat-containing protein [Coraliomargarita sp. SDUM461004]
MPQGLKLYLIALLATQTASAAIFYLSPAGNDSNPGTIEAPFATLERARTATRATNGPSTVILTPGRYPQMKTFQLDERDSNTTFSGKGALITGSKIIPNQAIEPVTDPAILKRLLPSVREKVKEIDLGKLGINDFGEIGPRGFRRPYAPAPLELFINGEPMSIAQWPNPEEAPIPIGKVLDKGPVTRNGDKPTRGGTFEFSTQRPNRWTSAEDVWLTGIFSVGWADNTVKIKNIDLEKQTITTQHPHMYGFSSGKPWNTWTALNLLEEIDLAGEFMSDKSSGKIYFLPPNNTDMSKCQIEVTIMKDPLISIEGSTELILDGLEIGYSRGMGVYIERGSNNRVQNSTLSNLGIVAVCIGQGVKSDTEYRHNFTGQPTSRELGSWHEHLYDNTTFNRQAGSGHGIINCEIYNIGAGAISLGGGDRLSLTPANNFVDNCHIYNFNRWDRTYRGAINIDGVGNRVSHNQINNAPGVAIYLHGNNHQIEYNEIHHVMLEGDDMGAFYMGRDPSERGNVIRYNYWHDIGVAHSTYALYFDDYGGDGSHVYGNAFERAGTKATIFINHSSDILVENNLFIDCNAPFRINGNIPEQEELFSKRLAAVRFDQQVWTQHYPNFKNYFKVERRRNIILKNNLVIKSNDPYLADGINGDFNLNIENETDSANSHMIPFDKIGRQKL